MEREGFAIKSWHQDVQTGAGADALLLRPGLAAALKEARIARCLRAELDALSMTSEQLWVVIYLDQEAVRRGRDPEQPWPLIPTHEEAIEVIRSGNIDYGSQPEALKGKRCEDYGYRSGYTEGTPRKSD